MEHTHLVKGLDYALLQKVRSEIQVRETEQEAEMERLVTLPVEPVKEKEKKEVPVVCPNLLTVLRAWVGLVSVVKG
ncbi:hypothetical protein JYU34_012160 [Plutella xylostella]|uniref:RED-like N-terminal domain-containing protein n=1 Tax=Plutella xylostella TaxID=51655 RepID=A0ABQ7QEI5_PLUXY|nr:hypothetical protein JYU34_012160 [Plutella xylostella]